MKLYQLDFRSGVRDAVDHLPGNLRQRVKRIFTELKHNPRPAYAEMMRDELADCYKISLGAWRIVYEVQEDILIILVLKVGKKTDPEFYHDIQR